jgi:Mn2+/Fe2+ NRAMP family transporter
MEGFLNLKIPIYQRVLFTRSVAVLPALSVSFLAKDTVLEACTYLNILQCLQLPFALIPLIKFASSKKVLREFAIPTYQTVFLSSCGGALTIMNFVVLDKEYKIYK